MDIISTLKAEGEDECNNWVSRKMKIAELSDLILHAESYLELKKTAR